MRTRSLRVEKCTSDLIAEGFEFADELTLQERQELVLARAVANKIIRPETLPLYHNGARRIVIVSPSHPE